MPKTKADRAIYSRQWRKKVCDEKRFNKGLRQYLEIKYQDIFNEYVRFYSTLNEAHPDAKDITKSKTYTKWKKDHQTEPLRNPEIPEPQRNPESREPPREPEIPEPQRNPESREPPREPEIPEPQRNPESREPPREPEIPEPQRNPESRELPREPEIPEPQRNPESREPPREPEIPEPQRNPESRESPRESEIPEPQRNPESPEPQRETPEPPRRPESPERDILTEALGEQLLPEVNLSIDDLDYAVRGIIEDLQRDDNVRALLNNEEFFPQQYREEDESIDMDVEMEIEMSDMYDIRLEEALMY